MQALDDHSLQNHILLRPMRKASSMVNGRQHQGLLCLQPVASGLRGKYDPRKLRDAHDYQAAFIYYELIREQMAYANISTKRSVYRQPFRDLRHWS